MYNGNRDALPVDGGILNGFDWCCWNPLKTRDPPGYVPTPKAVSVASAARCGVPGRMSW